MHDPRSAPAVRRTGLDDTRRRPDRGNGFHSTHRVGRRIAISTSTPAPPGSPVTIRASWDTVANWAFRWSFSSTTTVPRLSSSTAQFGGKPQTARRLHADLRGAIAALAAKSAPNDETVQTVLRIFGDLRRDLTYAGSARAGYATEDDVPGAANRSGRLQPPLPLDEIAGPAVDQDGACPVLRGVVAAIADHAAAGGRNGRDRPRLRSGAGRHDPAQ